MKVSNRFIVFSVVLIVVLTAQATWAFAHGGDSSFIHACAKLTGGQIRIVGPNDICNSNETPIDLVYSIGGKVGIGVASPLEALEVAGTVKATEFEGFGIVPVGTIMAWHKSLSGTPSLPAGWVECNGQVLSDPASPYDGQMIPDLNGQGRFLRGSTTSGVLQSDQMQGHVHYDFGHIHGVPNVVDGTTVIRNIGAAGLPTEPNNSVFRVTDEGFADLGDPSPSGFGPVNIGSENRPINMSVVWIIRVK